MAQEQTIRSFYEAASAKDVQKFLSFFAEDGQFTDKSSGKVFRGRNEIKGMIEGWMKGLPDFKLQLSNVIGSGDAFSVEFNVVGTHTGPLVGAGGEIPASGKKVNVPSCDVIRLKNDKIQSLNCYLEASVLMDQIGVTGGRKAA